MLKSDVIVVTANGQGSWFLQELAKYGLTAQVLDVTTSLPLRGQEEKNGPFPYFHSYELIEAGWPIELETKDLEEIAVGLCVWTEKGPIEMRGPVYSHQWTSQGLSQSTQEYLSCIESSDSEETLSELRTKLKSQDFEKTWLAHLASSAVSVFDYDFPKTLNSVSAPILSTLFWSKNGVSHKKDLKSFCEELGHHYRAIHKLEKPIFSGSKLLGFEVVSINDKNTRTETVQSDEIVWMLNRIETQELSSELDQTLFARKKVDPMWAWIRFGIRVEPHPLFSASPKYFWMLPKLFEPWTHDNFMVISRFNDESAEVWCKVPHSRSNDLAYLSSLSARIQLRWQDKFDSIRIVDFILPNSTSDKKASRQPRANNKYVVYDHQIGSDLSKSEFRNFTMLASDSCGSFDQLNLLRQGQKLIGKFVTDRLSKGNRKTEEVNP